MIWNYSVTPAWKTYLENVSRHMNMCDNDLYIRLGHAGTILYFCFLVWLTSNRRVARKKPYVIILDPGRAHSETRPKNNGLNVGARQLQVSSGRLVLLKDDASQSQHQKKNKAVQLAVICPGKSWVKL